jgi:uncharacterized protein (DUF305 family)
MSRKLSGRVPAILALGALAVAAACSPNADSSATDTTAASTARDSGAAGPMAGMNHDSAGGMAGMNHDSMSGSMAGMTSMPAEDRPHMRMTGNADQDFLRMMSDHHRGLIAMSHLSTEGDKKGSAQAQADAKKLDTKQDAELDSMTTMLEQQFKDKYEPMIMPSNQAMVDQLESQSGAAYDRTFYQNVVKHHQQALKMIDEFSPKLQNAQIKRMAERMKEDQQREIREFEQKASKG